MITKTIEELSIQIKTGKTPSTRDKLNFEDGEYNWFTPGDFRTPKILKDSKRKITDYAAKNNAVIYQPNTILITCIGDIGNTGIIKKEASANQQITGIVVDSDIIIPEFFLYWVKANKQLIQDEANQAVVPIINNKGLKRIKVTFPSDLPTQNKIVALLDKASALVQKREKSIAQFDELLRAQFLNMFGDPVLNPKGWELKSINQVCKKIYGGGTPSKSKPEYYNGDIPWVTPKDMKTEIINDSKIRINQKGIDNSSAKLIPKNNVIMVIRSGILKHTLPLAINSKDVTINQDLKAFIPNVGITNSIFLLSFFKATSNYLLDMVRAVTADNIEFKLIKNLNCIVPPIELQNQFETIYHNIQSQKETLNQSKTELENLYNSLLQRAFSGQLNFNIDIELDALLATIDLEQDVEKEKHDINEIATAYAGRLLERIEEQNFENQTQYQQAKEVVFQMLKEGIVEQQYNEKTEEVTMKLI